MEIVLHSSLWDFNTSYNSSELGVGVVERGRGVGTINIGVTSGSWYRSKPFDSVVEQLLNYIYYF